MNIRDLIIRQPQSGQLRQVSEHGNVVNLVLPEVQVRKINRILHASQINDAQALGLESGQVQHLISRWIGHAQRLFDGSLQAGVAKINVPFFAKTRPLFQQVQP